ncbi:MAG TPA: NB-ARC domain-containing protein, partial [Thermomicrobiales bacterium]|nr:NB-ARC domain-containing protein [Thermomicrobiales bacterium]
MDHSRLAAEPDLLPVSLSSLVGREAEIGAVVSLIQRDDVRLVTLTGPGGVGKTRLALEIARRSSGNFADGIRFVDLSAVQDHRLVISEVMQVLGVSSSSPSVETMLVALSRRPNMLLILDNFEQVIDAATEIAALIKGSADLTVLVTSRESLKIDGEREFPIAPLALPSASARLDLEQYGQLDAVRLFLERAQSMQPTFALTTENAAMIADICSRLDGLPLAIELAAARVKVLPISTLLDRLEHRLPILVGGRRDTPERQQTMRNAIAWSYSLLTPQEQQLFRRLGVFVGGFTLAAAEAIGAVANQDDDVVLLLESLVDKSLVRLDQSAPTAPRYLMLDTIHEFAAEQLRASAESAFIRNAHATWCIQIGEERRLHGNIWTEPGWATPDIPLVTI